MAYALGRPVATGLKGVAVEGETVRCEQEVAGGRDVYVLPLPGRRDRPRGTEPAALSVGAGEAPRAAKAGGRELTDRGRSRGSRSSGSSCPKARARRRRSSATGPRRRRPSSRCCRGSASPDVVLVYVEEPGRPHAAGARIRAHASTSRVHAFCVGEAVPDLGRRDAPCRGARGLLAATRPPRSLARSWNSSRGCRRRRSSRLEQPRGNEVLAHVARDHRPSLRGELRRGRSGVRRLTRCAGAAACSRKRGFTELQSC